jgi:hypothetical protein
MQPSTIILLLDREKEKLSFKISFKRNTLYHQPNLKKEEHYENKKS